MEEQGHARSTNTTRLPTIETSTKRVLEERVRGDHEMSECGIVQLKSTSHSSGSPVIGLGLLLSLGLGIGVRF